MGLADSTIPVCISNIAQKTLHPVFSLPYEGRLALSHSSKADIVVEYCIMTGNYDIMEINQILFKLDLQPLGY